jgi:hypothetical protein
MIQKKKKKDDLSPGGRKPNTSAAVDDESIEEGDRIFATCFHNEPAEVRTTQNISQWLAEVSHKNSEIKSFRDVAPDCGAKYFTKLNVHWGYNNIRIKEGDEWKAMFRTNHSLFEPLVMFFRLTNSPETFQTMINEIFQDFIMEGVVCVCTLTTY